jgi:hypothetical protein
MSDFRPRLHALRYKRSPNEFKVYIEISSQAVLPDVQSTCFFPSCHVINIRNNLKCKTVSHADENSKGKASPTVQHHSIKSFRDGGFKALSSILAPDGFIRKPVST